MAGRPQLPDRAPRANGAPTALDGLLVVDFTRVVAGPACTQTLADFGAEVIKIENPDGGDDTRSYEHADLAGESAAFICLNRNKRGIALDLAKPEARDIARELIARADVEVALFDVALGMTEFYGMAYLMTGVNPSRQGNSPNGSPSLGVYHGSDARFYIACANDRLYRRLVIEVLGRPDLASGEFADRRSRTANKDKLRAILTGIFAKDNRENWVTKMKAANIPVGYLRTVEEAFNSGEVRERHRVSQIPHPAAGFVPNIESPLRLELTPATDPVAAPMLGEHTMEVLRKTLGYDDVRIAALADAGVFGTARSNA